MNDQDIEREILDKGLTAPRVTPSCVDSVIVSEHYFTAEGAMNGADGESVWHVNTQTSWPVSSLSRLTFCVLVLKNGFTVTGESACVSQDNFDAEIGRKIARANAVQKIWPLLGYALRNRMAEELAI